MKVSARFIGTTAMLDLRGGLTNGADTESLFERVRHLRSRGAKRFVLNLAGVDRWDCSGIGKLVLLYVEVQAIGAHLRLCNVDRRLENLLDLFRLSRVLGARGSEREALASFKRRRRIEIGATARTAASFQAQVPKRRTARARIDSRGRIAAQARVSL